MQELLTEGERADILSKALDDNPLLKDFPFWLKNLNKLMSDSTSSSPTSLAHVLLQTFKSSYFPNIEFINAYVQQQ